MKRINNDINGNPRYVVSFLDLLTVADTQGLDIDQKFNLAIKKARKVGGKIYRGKDFGGGIVIQSFDILQTINKVNGL
jgi:uncharacterized lipoprotein NlpE involved in copper resistance